MTDALKDEFPDPETELAFLDFLATEWPNWRHHVGSDYWHIRRRSFLAGRPAPQALAATPALQCDHCGNAFAADDDVLLMGSRGNFHQSCYLKDRAATPAVGGHELAEYYRRGLKSIVDRVNPMTRAAVREACALILSSAPAAQPASPLRGRDIETLKVCKVGFQNLVSLTEQTDIDIRDVCLQKIDWALSEQDGLLRRARQFVADAGCDEDDHDVNLARDELLAEIDAALSASPPEQPAADPSVEQRAHLHDAERIPQYPSGCLHPADCQSRGMCQSMSCKHAGKVIVKRVCVESKEAGIVYPKVEAS